MESRPTLLKLYGSKVFREAVIRERLTKQVYQSFLKTIEEGLPLDVSIAPKVATAMMQWAIEQGATHYAHWFLPMSNVTASKHDAFLNPTSIGEAVLEFPSETLVKGEPDASSFPSGGLRATFEARGYTAWDPTSPAFISNGTLYIPSVFMSFTGEALDQKVPLLKSIEALNKQGLRFFKFFSQTKDATRVNSTVGAEQEYFLIDRDVYSRREDLKLCGRTLLGASPAKGQQLDDHYMARIRIRVAKFMEELDHNLWELGVPAKTKHNEVAPAQHELACVYETANISSDHNQMVMNLMRTIAKQNGLSCLLHEKPFKGVNGSGKHNNYSLQTNTGKNILSPHPFYEDEGLFLLSVCAFIRGCDIYADLLRTTAASASNDHRLGGFEAPPAIVTIFLGEAITQDLLQVGSGKVPTSSSHDSFLSVVPSLPELQIDESDRNRTSPMAFTGNKFEFRMLGSSQSIANCNTILNTIIADSFSEFADRLEKVPNNSPDYAQRLLDEKVKIISDTLKDHGKIIFNGNNYSSEWIEEAKKRGLPILTNTVDSLSSLLSEKNISLFEKFNIFKRNEVMSRFEVYMSSYTKTIHIEASTMLEMVKREIIPAIMNNAGKAPQNYKELSQIGIENPEMKEYVSKYSSYTSEIIKMTNELERSILEEEEGHDVKQMAIYTRDVILANMEKLRKVCDQAESITSPKVWPFPSYTQILYSV